MGIIHQYIAKTEYVAGLTLDIGYYISECFYFGPAHFIPNELWLKKRAAVYRPQVDIYAGFALSGELMGKEEEIEKYYSNIRELSSQYEKELKKGDPYFWLNPVIYEKQHDIIGFQWHDDFQQATEVLQLLESNQNGLIFHHRLADWELMIFADATRYYFIYRNPLEDRDIWLVNTDRDKMQKQAHDTMERVRQQINRFSHSVGVDFWTEGIQTLN